MVRQATRPHSHDHLAETHDSERPAVKSATEARQGGRPKQMLWVLAASLILAAVVAAVLAGVFQF